jgi:hypothetical protein
MPFPFSWQALFVASGEFFRGMRSRSGKSTAMQGWTRGRENSVVPPGLESLLPLSPALKRWAKLDRPSGARGWKACSPKSALASDGSKGAGPPFDRGCPTLRAFCEGWEFSPVLPSLLAMCEQPGLQGCSSRLPTLAKNARVGQPRFVRFFKARGHFSGLAARVNSCPSLDILLGGSLILAADKFGR